MARFTIQVQNFKRLRSNTLFGFCDIFVPELHLRIFDVTVHQSHGKRWVGLPAKPQVTREGSVRWDERGKSAYSSVLEFTDTVTGDAFSARAIEALIAAYPTVFDDEVVA